MCLSAHVFVWSKHPKRQFGLKGAMSYEDVDVTLVWR